MHAWTLTRRISGISLLLLLAVPVHAQLGALRRAAGKAVEQKAEDRSQVAMLIEPTFDATTIEITTERLDRYTAAMLQLKSQRAARQQRYDQMQTEINALTDSAQASDNDRDRNNFERSSTTYSECRSGVQKGADAAMEQRTREMTAKMQRDPVGAQSDPRIKEMMAAVQAMGVAQQSGDAAAIKRAQDNLMRITGAVPDSASLDRAAAAKCGARPAKPASMVRREAFQARADSTRTAANALMSSSGGVKGNDVGMTDLQAHMFWERIMSWLNGMRQDALITRTFTKAEYDLLVARRRELRAAFSGG
jgi:hypothetical protein